MNSVVIVSAVRTPIGKLGGALHNVLPEELTKLVLNEAISRAEINKEQVDEVIVGQTKQTTDAPNLARVASLSAGIPEHIPAYTVHRQCSSGMQSIVNAIMQIQTGHAKIVLAGGVESMSTAPYYLRQARFGYKAGNGYLLDPNTESQPKSQPEEIYGTFNMGITAENLAEKYNISRKAQDEFALSSQEKAIDAIDREKFKEEILPVQVKERKREFIVDTDEHPRRDTNLEKMSKLKPAFKPDGTVTAGNSAGRNDGASAMVVMSEAKAQELEIKPLARFVSMGIAGVSPQLMGIGPVPATRKALKNANLDLSKIDVIELNEAFSAQSLAVVKELNLNLDKLNINGGAIALGHPLGCSGNRIVVTLLHEMKRNSSKYGLATICVAGGQGLATVYESINV